MNNSLSVKSIRGRLTHAAALTLFTVLAGFMTQSATAAQLYGVTGDGANTSETLFTIDTTNATSASVLTLGNGSNGETIGFNPVDGLMYHASGTTDGDRFWESIDLSTPVVASSTLLGGFSENLAMVWDSSAGTFLMSNLDNSVFYQVDTAGNLTDIGSTPENLKGLAFVGSQLYGLSTQSSILYQLDSSNGASQSFQAVTGAGGSADIADISGFNGMAVDPDTGQVYAIARGFVGDQGGRYLVTLDTTTGIATSVGLLSDKFAGIAFGAPIPEPEIYAMLGMGLGLLGWVGRRKRLQAA